MDTDKALSRLMQPVHDALAKSEAALTDAVKTKIALDAMRWEADNRIRTPNQEDRLMSRDPEVAAIQKIVKILNSLEPDTCDRVVKFIASRFLPPSGNEPR